MELFNFIAVLFLLTAHGIFVIASAPPEHELSGWGIFRWLLLAGPVIWVAYLTLLVVLAIASVARR